MPAKLEAGRNSVAGAVAAVTGRGLAEREHGGAASRNPQPTAPVTATRMEGIRPSPSRREAGRGRPSPSRAIALATAGPIGGTPGSPTPVGFSVDETMTTSTSGISLMRSER